MPIDSYLLSTLRAYLCSVAMFTFNFSWNSKACREIMSFAIAYEALCPICSTLRTTPGFITWHVNVSISTVQIIIINTRHRTIGMSLPLISHLSALQYRHPNIQETANDRTDILTFFLAFFVKPITALFCQVNSLVPNIA